MCRNSYYVGQRAAVCQWKSAHTPSLAHSARQSAIAYKEMPFSLICKLDIFQINIIDAFLDTALNSPRCQFMHYHHLNVSSIPSSCNRPPSCLWMHLFSPRFSHYHQVIPFVSTHFLFGRSDLMLICSVIITLCMYVIVIVEVQDCVKHCVYCAKG